MKVNIKNLISITEANQNFSKVAKMVDDKGVVVILKNNKPRYALIEYNKLEEEKKENESDVEALARDILERYREAFEELAK